MKKFRSYFWLKPLAQGRLGSNPRGFLAGREGLLALVDTSRTREVVAYCSFFGAPVVTDNGG